jgi:hypothetical protein
MVSLLLLVPSGVDPIWGARMVPSRLDRGKKPRKWRKALAPDRRDTRVVFATPHLLDADACVLPAALQGDRLAWPM